MTWLIDIQKVRGNSQPRTFCNYLRRLQFYFFAQLVQKLEGGEV